MLAFGKSMVYNGNCCDIDSEEARGCHPVGWVFRGANVKRPENETLVGKPDGKSLYEPYFLPLSR